MTLNRVIVVGASAGGVGALCTLMQELPENLPAAILIVQHVGPHSALTDVLRRCHRNGGVESAHDGAPVEPGRIYVAVPDRHLVLEDGHIALRKMPRENLHRPSVDALFRSAARAYGPKVIGVVLTGALDDGASGLFTIKARGGIAVVHDPSDAVVPDMPLNALNAVDPDYCLPLTEIAPLLVKLANQPVVSAVPAPPEGSSESNNRPPIADDVHPAFVCPECDGPLTQSQNGNLVTYQCKIGHRFSLESLSEAAAETLERGLWIAVRSLEDRAEIQRQRATRYSQLNRLDQATAALEIAVQAEQDSKTLRHIMERL